MTGFVYAMAAQNGLVKIGFSEKPHLRLSKVNSDAGSRCELVGFVPASRAQEKELQRLLAPHRDYGEWFRNEGVVAHFLAKLPMLPDKKAAGRKRKAAASSLHPLSKYRALNSLTMNDVAKLVGVTQCSLSRIENGKQGITAQMAMALERATNIPLHALRPDLWPKAEATQARAAG